MEQKLRRQNYRAFSLIELLLLVAVLSVLAALFLPVLAKSRARSKPVNCTNHMKQVAFAFRIWEFDHQDQFPMTAESTKGDAMKWLEEGSVFKIYQLLSNELVNPKILVCPADTRLPTKDFTRLTNTNLSYFVGLDTVSAKEQMFLVGDRNVTNGLASARSVLSLPPDLPAGWTEAMHRKQGNVGLADGSVQSLSTSMLQEALKKTGDTTNRIALPEPQ